MRGKRGKSKAGVEGRKEEPEMGRGRGDFPVP